MDEKLKVSSISQHPLKNYTLDLAIISSWLVNSQINNYCCRWNCKLSLESIGTLKVIEVLAYTS